MRRGMRLVAIIALVAFIGPALFRFLLGPVVRLITGVSAAAGPYAGMVGTGLRAVALLVFVASLWWSIRKMWQAGDPPS